MAFGGSKTSAAAQSSAAANGHLEGGGARIESAIGRILGHGRRTDAGSYEMVGMRSDDGPP